MSSDPAQSGLPATIDNRPPILTATSSIHSIPGPKRYSFIAGSFPQLFKASPINHLEKWTDEYGPVVKIPLLLGMSPGLVISDPDIAKRVLVTEPEAWTKPPFVNYLMSLLFGPGLMSAAGDVHKRQRRMLNPLFASAQVRKLTGKFYDIAQKLSDKLTTIVETEGNDSGTVAVDFLQLASAAALDAIGSAGLGYDFDAINTDSDYKLSVKKLMPTVANAVALIPFVPLLRLMCPASLQSWFMKTFCPWLGNTGRSALELRRILEIMQDTSLGVFRHKQAQVEADGQASQADILSNLVHTAKADASFKLTEEEAVAQINTMIFGGGLRVFRSIVLSLDRYSNIGHETTANTISRLLEHLAHDTELQSRLHAEIVESNVVHNQSYDGIMNLPLLDAACKEILRLYPPIQSIVRLAEKDTVFPLSQPIKSVDGKTQLHELFAPKGTSVHITISGMNRSTAIWGPDAKDFRLERWLNPLPEAATKVPGVLSSSLAFSAGARSCIGWKFAFLEIKVITAVLLQNFVFEPNKKVIWMTAGVTFPVVDGEDESILRLPLTVSLRS